MIRKAFAMSVSAASPMAYSLRFWVWFGACLAAAFPARAQSGDPGTLLHRFSGPDGSMPTAALTQGSDGNFYGTTEFGGANNKGTIFQLTPAGALTTLRSFNGDDGYRPNTALIETGDGKFYGTTLSAGTPGGATGEGGGTIFQITREGGLRTIYSFSPVDENPVSLLRAGDGNLYGTTLRGGHGTVFRLTPAGVFMTLRSFNHPVGPLVLAHDGSLFGTVMNSGKLHSGFIYRITQRGTFTVIYDFAAADGAHPRLLLEGTDGAFYGTTGVAARLPERGKVFRVTAAGAFSVLCNVGKVDYASVDGMLIQARDGNFYGLESFTSVTDIGTAVSYGIFQLSPGGIITEVHGFYRGVPVSLIQGNDGGLYVTSVSAQGGIIRVDLVKPTVSVAVIGDTSFYAGGPVARLAFSRTSTDLSRDLRVKFALNGSAENGVDFTAPDGQPLPDTVLIRAGQATAELDLKAVAGAARSGDLSLYVDLVQFRTEKYVISAEYIPVGLTLLGTH